MYSIALMQNGAGVTLAGPGVHTAAKAARILPVTGGKETVQEEVELSLAGNAADMRECLDQIGRLLSRCQGQTFPVFLVCQLDAAGLKWQSQVVSGWIEYLKPGVNSRLGGAQAVVVHLARLNWWEGEERQLTLRNGNEDPGDPEADPPVLPDYTQNLNLYNCNDGTGENPHMRFDWIRVAATDAAGDLPAPFRLELTNLGTRAISYVWIGQNWTDPDNYEPFLEAEDANASANLAVTAGSVTESGESYGIVTLASGVENTLLDWTLDPAMLAAASGQRVHAMIRFVQNFNITLTKFRLRLDLALTTFWSGEQVRPTGIPENTLIELGSFRLPPGLEGLDEIEAFDLVLTGQQASGVDKDLYIDYLALLPGDGWRMLWLPAYGCPTYAKIIDDGMNGKLYLADGNNEHKAPVISSMGEQLWIRPGVDQKFYFLLHANVGSVCEADMKVGVKIFYRPRRQEI